MGSRYEGKRKTVRVSGVIKFQWNFDQRKGNLVRGEFELSEFEFSRGWEGGEGRAPDPSFPLIFHENPASRTVFHLFPVFF